MLHFIPARVKSRSHSEQATLGWVVRLRTMAGALRRVCAHRRVSGYWECKSAYGNWAAVFRLFHPWAVARESKSIYPVRVSRRF